MTEPSVHVTLVHGTFARNAKWVKKGSPMSRRLEEEGFACHSFTWSGANSHRGRARAAEKLAEHLRDEEKRLGSPPQAVVAHSHGGNIALHAVWRLLDVRDGSIPVVAMATPFVFAVRKRVHGAVLYLAAIAFLLAVAGAASLVVEGPGGAAWSVRGATLLLLVVCAAQVVSLIHWIAAHGPLWRKHVRAEFLETTQTPTPEPDDRGLLVVRAADDEAGVILSLAQLAAWLAAAVMRITRPGAWASIAGALFSAAWLASLIVGGDLPGTLLTAIGAIALLASIFSLVIVSAPALVSFVHGLDGPAASLFAFVSAEATPPGHHAVLQRAPIKDLDRKRLAHSSLYDDPEVIGWVVDHVRKATAAASR